MRSLVRGFTSILGGVALLCGLAGFWAQRTPADVFERSIREFSGLIAEHLEPSEDLTDEGRAGARRGLEAWISAVMRLRQPLVFGSLIAISLALLAIAASGRSASPTPGKKKKGEGSEESRKTSAAPEHNRKDAKKIAKLALRVQSEHGAEAAGDFLLDHGLPGEALELFQREGLDVRAAEVLQDQNRFEDAARLYEKAGKHEKAAGIYAQIDRFEDAGRCYRAAEKNSVAAEMYEKGGKYRHAAECYREIGFGRHAAQAFLKAGAEPAAAECMVAVFDEESAAGAKSEEKQAELRALAKKAGELLFKLERFEEAEQILVRAGIYQTAAKIALHRGAYDLAAEWFGRIGRGDLQARALEQLGQHEAAARALAHYLKEKGDSEGAAEAFVKCGEHGEAAGLYQALGRFEEAGAAFAAAGEVLAAAEMYQAVERFDLAGEALARALRMEEAAACFGKAGDTARQAQILEGAGRFLPAGLVHAKAGRYDEAIRALQQVEPESPDHRRACSLLGRLFQKKGMETLSITKYEQATDGEPVTKANVESFYNMAVLRHTRGDAARAAELFEKVLAFDYEYRDTSERLEAARRAERSSTNSPALAGRQERYRVLQEIGRGGMGVVYLARDALLERDVAYKVLPEQLRESPEALRGFLREAKAAAQLNHPNIVTVYDVGESEHGFYMAMEYVEGTTLKAIVQKRGAIAPGGVMYVLRQMAEALGYAHSRKVVHRDIKTANTMWTQDKQVKIMDFGLARLMEEVRNATTTISGTPFYMSPEQTLGRNIDHRADLYSLGVTLYELSTGELPFRKGNVPYHHVHTAPRDPREINSQLPDPLAEVILRCMQKAPEDRYGSARELIEDLTRRLAEAQG